MTAEPLHVQYLDHALKIEPLLSEAERVFKEEITDSDFSSDSDEEDKTNGKRVNAKRKNGYLKYQDFFSASDWRAEKRKFYNVENIDKEREWLVNCLLSDSSDESYDEDSLSEEEVKEMLKWHVHQKRIHRRFMKNPIKYQEDFQYYGSSFVLERDRYYDFQKKQRKEKKALKKKSQVDLGQRKRRLAEIDERRRRLFEEKLEKKRLQRQKEADNKRRKLWILIARKEIPKAWRQRNNARSNQLQTLKKVAQHCLKEVRKEALRSQKISKEMVPRARRLVKEVLLYWKKFDKVEKEHRKKAEKEALEQRRLDEEMREMRRQQRKLNFLITQTELYAHFMGRKMKGPNKDSTQDEILKKLDEPSLRNTHMNVKGGVLVDVENQDDYDSESMKAQALMNAQNAVMMQEQKTKAFDESVGCASKLTQESFDEGFSLANPKLFTQSEKPQPIIFSGKLKTYQLKGMNWLADLYEQGINGILADEMGLGKTVQSIAFLAYLAEVHDIWGPFLVVAPASTLHNWQQEASRFVPEFKVLPYWGNPSDRKSLRKFWNQRQCFVNTKENAPFHVLITSYQLVVQDVRYFQRIKWQYLVLDEAQAIKSSASVRWKILLGFNCRNRLLLTGTPIQNSMAELWALLHFIMPTLFDSHEEFNEWFSKDIEGHAENKSNLDQNQLSRLHMILKPFMLRRVKKDVENELSDKIEIKLVCHLSSRQRFLYQAVKNKISIEDLVASTSSSSNATAKSTSTLMNLVMQFRKVCNHPEIFERRDVKSPLFFRMDSMPIPKLIYHEGILNHSSHARLKLLYEDLSVWRKDHILESLQNVNDQSPFSVSRFINTNPEECYSLMTDPTFRLLHLTKEREDAREVYHRRQFGTKQRQKCWHLGNKDLIIWPNLATSCVLREGSTALKHLIFTRNIPMFYAHVNHYLHKRKDLKGHDRRHCFPLLSNNTVDSTLVYDEPTSYPSFLNTLVEKVVSPPQLFYVSDRDAAYKTYSIIHGQETLRHTIATGTRNSLSSNERNALLFPPPLQGLEAARPDHGWAHLQMPDRNALITDSGKLKVLDTLLTKLKAGGHRVLIYSQMTRMIDILEEFMAYRKYKYMRLDGSSKISDRRDMVSDFQTRSDIFVFLLSTRAGGLGINLTAADTVIFYDSDWNPTVDQQAMDRAHRLGQTKQVTVYRLVTKGSIEERILQRAKEKSEIQKLVISGGHFKPDALKPKEVVSLLLDDDEMENKFKLKQAERKSEEQTKKGGRKRKKVDDDADQQKAGLGKRKNNSFESVDAVAGSTNGEMFGSLPAQLEIASNTNSICDESIESTDVVSFNFNEDSNTSFGTPQSSRPPSTVPVISEPSSPSSETLSKRGKGRGRGRGRGTVHQNRLSLGKTGSSKSRGGKSKGASLNEAAAAAAAAAGAAAASAAAYAAYGFSFQATSGSNSG